MELRLINTFGQHRRRYGARRVKAALVQEGVRISLYKTRRLMRTNGLKAIQPKCFLPRTTNSRHKYAKSPNLLKDKPFPTGINQVWTGDITYIPMAEGRFQYLAVWMDLYSRKIVGWDLQWHMRESLVIEALNKAIIKRNPPAGLIIHSDKGGQYASNNLRQLIANRKLLQSMCSAEKTNDNAHMESCFSRFKAELMENGVFQNEEDSRTEIFEYIEMYYNTKRLHSALQYNAPDQFENNNIYD